jgi:hypothetical protein
LVAFLDEGKFLVFFGGSGWSIRLGSVFHFMAFNRGGEVETHSPKISTNSVDFGARRSAIVELYKQHTTEALKERAEEGLHGLFCYVPVREADGEGFS